MQDDLFTIGVLGRPHGVRGQIKCHPQIQDFDFFKNLKTVFVSKGNKLSEYSIAAGSTAGKDWLLKFEGIDSPEEVARLTNGELQIFKKDRPELPDGEYYLEDFPGFKIIDETGAEFGEVNDVLELPSVDAFAVQQAEGKEVLVPWVDDCVLEIDEEAKTITCAKEFLDSLLASATGEQEN